MKAKWLVLLLATGGCAEDIEFGDPSPREGDLASPLRVQRVPAPLGGAHCSIDVDGVGTLDMEMDYLPHVITCENGGANLEGLKAQAIAARSVAYYNIETSGSICDGQGCQVYSCGAEPGDLAYQAVMETSGMYLMYNNTLTYGFYVAGDTDTAPPECVGVSGSTEGWVTYNEGRSGTDVIQTELGFVHDPGDVGYGQNRGCMSQWGGRCLENNNGYDYLGILRFYYGDDIETPQAMGECVSPVDPTDASSSGGMESGGTAASDPSMTSTDPSDSAASDPATSSPSTASASGNSASASASQGGDSESESGEAGTAGDEGPGSALPGNYGGSGDDGCGCSGGRAAPGWIFLLLPFALRARSRRISLSARPA